MVIIAATLVKLILVLMLSDRGPESCVDFLANSNLQSFLTSLCKSHINLRERIYFLARVYLTEQNVHQMDQIDQFVDSDRQFLLLLSRKHILTFMDNFPCNVSLCSETF